MLDRCIGIYFAGECISGRCTAYEAVGASLNPVLEKRQWQKDTGTV
jgi:hypothetical protein